jgi:hypothetical protein
MWKAVCERSRRVQASPEARVALVRALHDKKAVHPSKTTAALILYVSFKAAPSPYCLSSSLS